MVEKSLIVLTPGDPDGIGPEITWKAIQALQSECKQNSQLEILCIGARAPFQKLNAPIQEIPSHLIGSPLEDLSAYLKSSFLKNPAQSNKPYVWILPAPEQSPNGRFIPGYQSGWSIEKATHLVLSGTASALVTGPISKERLQKGGYFYPGHTEFLAELCKGSSPRAPEVTMMLANETLKVSLVTTHVAVKQVSECLSREKIRRAVLQTAEGIRTLWGSQKPRIGITALNPHAGESGLFGREEIEIIEPEIRSLRETYKDHFELIGPLPADTLFANHLLSLKEDRFDAVVCMYHDQGLIPVKLLDFHNTVNVTLGLPIIRTSVDHGVGFDIAGKGIANASSLCAAIRLAKIFVEKKRR